MSRDYSKTHLLYYVAQDCMANRAIVQCKNLIFDIFAQVSTFESNRLTTSELALY